MWRLIGGGSVTFAASDGEAVTFSSRGSFADAVGAGSDAQTRYLSRRTAAGWSTTALTPTPSWDDVQYFFGNLNFDGFSDDLHTAILSAYNLPGFPGATPNRGNLFLENTESHALQLISESHFEPTGQLDISENHWGISRDAKHLSLQARARLLPEAPSGVPSVYEWDEGTLRLASILPDGEPASEGAVTFEYEPEAVTPDGRGVLFLSPPSGAGQLYERVDHQRTVWVSQPELGGTVEPTPENIQVEDVTADGRHILFSTTSQLLPEDANEGRDIYLYSETPDPASEHNLTLISKSGDAAFVVGSAADASRVYFRLEGGDIDLWEEGITRHVVGEVLSEGAPNRQSAWNSWSPGGARVSADGRYLAFLTAGTPSGDGVHREMYLFDAERDELTCVSCPPGPRTSDATVESSVANGVPSLTLVSLEPRFLSSEATVFFSTGEALVPEDTNGVSDAYEYSPPSHRLSLLSTGKGSDPASFVEADTNGSDAFIVTRQRLVSADKDESIDLYAVRVDGGFQSPPSTPPPCEPSSCQREGSGAPGAPLVTSTAYAPGNRKCSRNRHRARHCGRHPRRRRHHSHPRKPKPGQQHKSRSANR